MLEEKVTSGSSGCPMASGGGALPLGRLPPRLTWQLGQWRWGTGPAPTRQSPLLSFHRPSHSGTRRYTLSSFRPRPQASSGPPPPLPLTSQGQRGGHTPSPEGGDEGCEERPAVSRSPQPARVLGRGYRPHLSSAWGQWPWRLLSLGLRDREGRGRPRTHVDKLGSGAVMRVGHRAALGQGTNPQSLRETFPLSRAVSHEGLSPIKLGPA